MDKKDINKMSSEQLKAEWIKLGKTFFIIEHSETKERKLLPFTEALNVFVEDARNGKKWKIIHRIEDPKVIDTLFKKQV